MTITLYWWMLPLFIATSTVLFALYDYHTDNSYLKGTMGFIVSLAGISISFGIIVGHFL